MDHPGAAMHHVQFIEPLQERFVRRVPSLRGALGPRDRPTPPRRLRRHPLHHVVPDPTSTWHSRSHVAPRGGRPPSPSSPALRGGSHTRPGDSCTTHHHGTTRLARVLGGAPPSRSVTSQRSPASWAHEGEEGGGAHDLHGRVSSLVRRGGGGPWPPTKDANGIRTSGLGHPRQIRWIRNKSRQPHQ